MYFQLSELHGGKRFAAQLKMIYSEIPKININHMILMAMMYASIYSYTVYVDNILITGGNHTSATPAPLVADTLRFKEPSYTIAAGKWVEAPAALTIQPGYTYNNDIIYTSSAPVFAIVSPAGAIF